MGVTRTVVREGTGRTPHAGEVVKAHYTGRLKDSGREFDSSRDRGKPIMFVIGIGSVIKGWDEGISNMKLGEASTLHVTSDYGYGVQGAGPIPPNADLEFDVELVAIGNEAIPGSSSVSTCEAFGIQLCAVQ
mmetsp:Transcript_29626/g.94794  ORF Transcript_29626/g.94794 Transcript_29626/m.94794 type:complete len:132 (-) Transcript_29626:300-695(-)